MISRITTFALEGVEARPIDVQVQLSGGANAFNIVGLPDKAVGESRERVRAAFRDAGGARRPINADAPSNEVDDICALDDNAKALVAKAAEQLALSARAYHRVLKVARTIADLDGSRRVARVHAAEALTYRFRPAVPAMPTRRGSPFSGLTA